MRDDDEVAALKKKIAQLEYLLEKASARLLALKLEADNNQLLINDIEDALK